MRLSKHDTIIRLAWTLAARSTCSRRKVACILLDKYGRIIGTGYNGVARGMKHCIDVPCEGAGQPSGEGLDRCEAIHAEQNALMECHDVLKIHTCVVTHSPCVHCVKQLMNTSCRRIIYDIEYPHARSEGLAKSANIEWRQHKMELSS